VRVKYLVVGAGITGCTFARLLQMRGEEDVVLLEAEREPGGLCRTKQIGRHVLDLGGGHFLCTKYPEVYDFIFAHLPKSEFNHFDRVSKIALDGEVIDYPIEFNLWQLTPERGRAYLDSCLAAGELDGRPQPTSFEEWIRWKLGDRIAESYMLPYNRKIWGVGPDEMDIDWLSKIPRVDTAAIRASFNDRLSDRSRMPSHDRFYYPKEGGFQRIFDAVSASVKEKIWLEKKVTKLEHAGDVWRVNDEIEAEVVVNTAPWSVIYAATGESGLEEAVAKLKVSAIVVSLYEESYDHDWHWRYCPDESLRFHREFFIHNFAPGSGRDGVYRETNVKRWRAGEGEVFSTLNEAAYPIPVRGHAAAIRAVREHFAARKLYGLGRWGQHSYFNSDVCIREAMQFVDTLLG
jgi:protoporphyrinogen oxidase